jgi:pimeloyl-ACP methyl ester carboxylesterase
MRPSLYFRHHIPLVGALTAETPLSKKAARRRNSFETPSDAEGQLRGRGAFATWRDPFLEDYIVDGVLRQDDRTYALACTPAWEAACFKAHRYAPWGAFGKLKRKRMPIIILQADRDSTALPDIDRRVHRVRPDAAVTKVPGTSHFLPMERPYVVRDALRLLYQATEPGATDLDYVGAVRRTIDDSIGIMS